MPLLFDLRISDLKGPLAQFQAKIFSEDGMLDIVRSINSTLQVPLEARVLERSFGRAWPELKERVKTLQSAHVSLDKTKSNEIERENGFVRDAIEELLTLSRSQNQLLASSVSRLESSELQHKLEVMRRRILRVAKQRIEGQTQEELMGKLVRRFPRTLKTLGWSESMLKVFLEEHSIFEADVPS